MKREQEITQAGTSNVYAFADYVSPRIQDVKAGKDGQYFLWGQNNEFYGYLRDLYLNSTTNNAAINGILKLAYGDGLSFDDRQRQIKLENVISKKELRRIMLQFYVYNKWVAQVEYHMTPEKTRDLKKGIRKVFFLPAKDVAPCKRDENGDVTKFFVSKDWSNTRMAEFKPKPVPAFGFGEETDEIEIYFWQLEIDNDGYFEPVMYNGCLEYSEIEIETSHYHLNHTLRQFAPSGIINFNNGVPPPDVRDDIVRSLTRTKTGSENAGKQWITFNEGAENAVTISAYDIPDPHKQYEFIAALCEKKILISHNVGSPLLFGIRDASGGLGSNANEIREAYEIMREMTLEPVRMSFLEGLEPILLEIGIPAAPKFSDLQIFQPKPTDIPGANTPESQFSEHTKHEHEDHDEPEDYSEAWIGALSNRGEVVSDEWQEVSSTAVDNPEAEDRLMSIMLADNTSPANGVPQDASEGDSGLFKVRYRYGPDALKSNSRDLCVFLVQKMREGVVYRKEDIDSWEDQGINKQFAPEGLTKYSLWLWKGGVYCHHRWFRVIYFRKRQADGTFEKRSTTAEMENDKKVSQPQARSQGLPENKLNPAGWPDAGTAPIDQPNRGSLKNR